MAFVLGSNAKAYRNTGTFGTPVWDVVDNVSKLKNGMTMETFNARRRASGLFNQHAVTGIDFSITWRMLFDLTDTDFTTIQAAAVACTEIDMLFLSGLVTVGAHQGPRISAAFSKFDRDEDEAGLLVVDVEVKPGITNLPVWFTGAA